MKSLWSWMAFIAAIDVIVIALFCLRVPARSKGIPGEHLWEKGGAWIGFHGASGLYVKTSGKQRAVHPETHDSIFDEDMAFKPKRNGSFAR